MSGTHQRKRALNPEEPVVVLVHAPPRLAKERTPGGYTLGIQSYLLRYGDWRHCYVGLEGPVVPSEKVLGSLGIPWESKTIKRMVFR